jgi:hypothetical protein
MQSFNSRALIPCNGTKWIRDNGWIDIINERFEIPALHQFVSADLNRSIGRSPRFGGINSLQEYNIHGLFKASNLERVGTKKYK